jgi:cytochrome c oxidase subunit 1
MSGIFVGSPPLDYHVTDSYFVVAHLHYVLFAGSFFGFFAGLYYWWPKITGRLLRDGLGKLHLALFVVGTNVTFLPMFFLGYDGMPRRVANYRASDGWTTLNVLATVGAFIIALSIAVFCFNVLVSWLRAEPAGARAEQAVESVREALSRVGSAEGGGERTLVA